MTRGSAGVAAAALLVLAAPACSDILHFDDLRTATTDDGGFDASVSDAAERAVGESGEGDAANDDAFGAAVPDAGVETTDAGGGNCAGLRCEDACVDPLTDPRHCGSCDTSCPTGATCILGACTCPAASPLTCSGACVDPTTDHANCGGCGNACPTRYRCARGACAPCGPADTTCAGVCTDVSVDPDNCGGCGQNCPSGAVCQAGACVCPSGDPTTCPATEGAGQQCASLTNDHNDCGGCGNVCLLAHATSVCSGAACAISGCAPGNADCDKAAATGCEVDTNADPSNCGGCGDVCSLANATPVCAGGRCAVGSCSPGYTDCDGLTADGCEAHTSTDPANCGVCGNTCNLTHATATCAAGACAIAACSPGFKDCDGIASNGCETDLSQSTSCGDCNVVCSGKTPLCSSSACVSGCPAAMSTLCGATCADIMTDRNNCGACGHACNLPNTSAICSGGACAIGSCSPGFADCDQMSPDGCEIHTAADLSNCGTCGKPCTVANGTPVCANSACAVASCNAGFADCNMLVADGCEANTAIDPNHCGGCAAANVCTGGKTCQSSACACPAGTHDCGGTCVSNSSPSTCGTSCMACPAPSNGVATCDGTACAMACTSDPTHPTLCGTACVNLASDPGNCGACGMACPTGGNCASTGCTCPTGTTNCGGTCCTTSDGGAPMDAGAD